MGRPSRNEATPEEETVLAPSFEEQTPEAKPDVDIEPVEPIIPDAATENAQLEEIAEGPEHPAPGDYWLDGWLVRISESGIAVESEPSKPGTAELIKGGRAWTLSTSKKKTLFSIVDLTPDQQQPEEEKPDEPKPEQVEPEQPADDATATQTQEEEGAGES
jgi:hypothetical protein